MIVVHHLLNSRSERVIWLLEELGEPYELNVIARNEQGVAPPEYRALHPMGTSPILTDGGLTLVETAAIIEHLLDRYGNGRLVPPRRTDDYSRYLQWMHFAEGSAAFSLIVEALMRRPKDEKPNRYMALWHDRNERMAPWLDAELARRPYFAGDEFTACDIMMNYVFGLYGQFARRDLSEFERIAAYRARIAKRPAYVRAMDIAGRQAA